MTRPTIAIIALALLAAATCAAQVDTDGDTIPDEIERQIATDPDYPEPLEVIHEDGVGEADAERGAECAPSGDYDRIWFAPVARGRYLWKIDHAGELQWPIPSHETRILYVDADNDPTTGRPKMGPGCDIMFYPNRKDKLIDWKGTVRSVAAADGNSLYLVADVDLNQRDGQTVFRMHLLYADTRAGQDENRDTTGWTKSVAAGEADRAPATVPADHPLYTPPQEVSAVGARVLFDREQPRAQITFITALTATPVVEYGLTDDYGATARGERDWNNHRITLPDLQEDQQYHYRVRVPGPGGEILTEDATFSTVRPAPPTCSVGRETVALTVDNPHPSPAENAPITTGLPFPRGTLGDPSHLRLLDADGREVPLQTEVTARYPDGSVQWLLLDFIADVPAESTVTYAAEFGSEVQRTVRPDGITVQRIGDALIVDTGVLEATINPESGERVLSPLPDPARGRIHANLPLAAVCVAEDGAWASTAAQPTVEVERKGPLSTIVKIAGPHASDEGDTFFRYVTRYRFTAGSALVRVQHTIENDQVDQPLTRVDQYLLPLRVMPRDNARVTVEGGPEGRVSFPAAEGSCVLTQDLANHWTLTAPGVERAGEHGPAAIDVSDSRQGLWVGLRHFREMWPCELIWHGEAGGLGVNLLPRFPDDRYTALGDAVESDRLYYHVRDGGYRLHSGVSFTRDIWLGFHEGGEWPDAWAQQLREPLVAVAEPQWYCDSGAFGPQLARSESPFEAYEVMVDRIFEGLMERRERNRSYGFLNFGDWWGERRYNWGNMEYDTPLAHMVQFARTGDRRFYDNALAAARHSRDVDYIHHHANSAYVGRTYYHRMFHTGGYQPRMTEEQRGLAYTHDTAVTGPLSGHQWNRGMLMHYYMTGEERSRRIALGLGNYMAGLGTINWQMGDTAERCAAWAMYDVLTSYEATWDPFYLNAARIMAEEALRRQTEQGHWGMVLRRCEADPPPVGGFAYFSGLLIWQLDRYNRYAQDPRVDEMLEDAAEWIARDEYDPRQEGFRVCTCEEFDDRIDPGDGAWSAAYAMALAWRLTGGERYLDIAQKSYAHFIPTARTMGKDYSLALVTSPHLVKLLHDAGRTSLDADRLSPGVE